MTQCFDFCVNKHMQFLQKKCSQAKEKRHETDEYGRSSVDENKEPNIEFIDIFSEV